MIYITIIIIKTISLIHSSECGSGQAWTWVRDRLDNVTGSGPDQRQSQVSVGKTQPGSDLGLTGGLYKSVCHRSENLKFIMPCDKRNMKRDFS